MRAKIVALEAENATQLKVAEQVTKELIRLLALFPREFSMAVKSLGKRSREESAGGDSKQQKLMGDEVAGEEAVDLNAMSA